MSGPAHANSLPDAAAWPRAAGIHDIETRTADGERVRFTLALPPDYAEGAPRPLVLVLHYAGQPTRFYGRPLLEQLIEPALRPLGALMAAPESRGGHWQDERNEAWVLALLETLQSTYPLAAGRLVVTGYSMGAIGTWHFVGAYPERIAAALPIAGFPNRDLHCTVPVRALHAASDELFPLARLQAAVQEAQAAGCPLELALAEVHGHYDVNGYAAAVAAALPWLQARLA